MSQDHFTGGTQDASPKPAMRHRTSADGRDAMEKVQVDELHEDGVGWITRLTLMVGTSDDPRGGGDSPNHVCCTEPAARLPACPCLDRAMSLETRLGMRPRTSQTGAGRSPDQACHLG